MIDMITVSYSKRNELIRVHPLSFEVIYSLQDEAGLDKFALAVSEQVKDLLLKKNFTFEPKGAKPTLHGRAFAYKFTKKGKKNQDVSDLLDPQMAILFQSVLGKYGFKLSQIKTYRMDIATTLFFMRESNQGVTVAPLAVDANGLSFS